MTTIHTALGNQPLEMHGIAWQTVANAAALAALTIVADDITQQKVIYQTDTGQLWIPVTVAPTFRLLGPQPVYIYMFGGDVGGFVPTDFLTPWASNGQGAAAELPTCTIKAGRAGVIRNLRLAVINGTTVTVDALTVAVRKNQVNTALSCSIPIAGTSASDLVNSISVLPTDDLAVTLITDSPTIVGDGFWATFELWNS